MLAGVDTMFTDQSVQNVHAVVRQLGHGVALQV